WQRPCWWRSGWSCRENSTTDRFMSAVRRAKKGPPAGGSRWQGLVPVPLEQVAVRVDPAVAQEGPDTAHVLAALHVDFAHEDFGLVLVGFGEEFALRSQHMAGSPELDSRRPQRRGF